MKPVVKSAAERLVEVKRDLPKLERERDALTAQWRQSLVNDDESAVERCERQLDVVERKLRRSQALIDLLPQQVAREAQAQRPSEWPSDLAGAEAALAGTRAERACREAIKPVDRSARCQQQIDHFRQREYALTKLIERLRPSEDAA